MKGTREQGNLLHMSLFYPFKLDFPQNRNMTLIKFFFVFDHFDHKKTNFQFWILEKSKSKTGFNLTKNRDC
jgi:hypothetical protein